MAQDLTRSPSRLIQSCPLELQVAILTHVPDLQALKSLILSCSAFSTAYYSHQRQVLLHLAQNTFDADKVNIAIPLLACRAQHIDVWSPTHLETVTTLLKAIPEHIEPTKQAIHEISVEECKQMLRLKSVASQICNDLISQVPLHHPLEGDDVMSYKPLSSTEKHRITVAVYRWELWAKLFSKQPPDDASSQDSISGTDSHTQMAVYLARYTRWEQEQLSCLYDYAHRRCDQLFGDSACWYHEKNPGLFTVEESFEEDRKPWEMLCHDRPFPINPILSLCTSLWKLNFKYALRNSCTLQPSWTNQSRSAGSCLTTEKR